MSLAATRPGAGTRNRKRCTDDEHVGDGMPEARTSLIRRALCGAVTTLPSWKWSPWQIAATLRRVYPDDPDRQVSHETIYTAIYAHPRSELERELIACRR